MAEKQEDEHHYPFEPIHLPPFLEEPTARIAEALWDRLKAVNVKIKNKFRKDVSIVEMGDIINFPEDEYGKQVVDHLQDGGSVVILSNHESHVDHALLLMHIAHPLKEKVDGVSYIWATGNKLYADYYQRVLSKDELKQYQRDIRMRLDKRIGYIFQGTIIRILAKHYRMNAFPVLQADQTEGKSKKFLRQIVTKLARKSLTSFEEEVNIPQRVAYFALEAGRDDGELKRAVSGLEQLIINDRNPKDFGGKRSSKKIETRGETMYVPMEEVYRKPDRVLFLPIGIKGTRDVLPKNMLKMNLYKEVEFVVGKPFTSTDVSHEADEYGHSMSDILMLHVVAALPQEKWGYYRAEKFKQYQESNGLLTK